METPQTKNVMTAKARQKGSEVADELEHVETALHERVDHVRDLVDDLRDRAEMAFHERPYLLPVATGALGLGIGVLIGSKLSRILILTAAGALLNNSVRGQVIRASRDFIRRMGESMEGEEGEGEGEHDIGEDVEHREIGRPSVT